MQLSCEYKALLEENNKKEYGENYHRLNWITVNESQRAGQERDGILSALGTAVSLKYKQTKLDCTRLSPGCETCGAGTWSCLFINGKCNCSCFYCPTQQDDIGVPTTNTLPFPRTADYLDYIERFGFKGVSISGGEPLLTLSLTLEYIEKIKKRFGEKIYLWMYTNGTLITEDIIHKLGQAGLDEIRFDIGATNYHLEKARLAVGHFKHVTVEVPAIPDHIDTMKAAIHEMHEIGVHYLNLHQLRLTPYNFSNIAQRNYTYLHGEKVTVLESELTALSLISYVHENNIDLPINYCSFVYKNRFQRAAARRRSAAVIRKPYEDITEPGYIRQLCLKGNAPDIKEQSERFTRYGFDETLWSRRDDHALCFNECLWKYIDFTRLHVSVTYYEAVMLGSHTYRNQFIQIDLNRNRKIVVEKKRVSQAMDLTRWDVTAFEDLAINRSDVPPSFESGTMHDIFKYECIPSGLQEYF